MSTILDIVSARTVTERRSAVSFQERVAWAQLVALAVATGAYVAVALSFWHVEGVPDVAAYAGLIGGAAALQAVVLVAGSAVAALTGRADRPDERDRLIAWQAASRSSWLLVAGVLVALTGLVLTKSPLWVANVLLAVLVAWQALVHALRLVAYRRGG